MIRSRWWRRMTSDTTARVLVFVVRTTCPSMCCQWAGGVKFTCEWRRGDSAARAGGGLYAPCAERSPTSAGAYLGMCPSTDMPRNQDESARVGICPSPPTGHATVAHLQPSRSKSASTSSSPFFSETSPFPCVRLYRAFGGECRPRPSSP
ncbi:hypothetical protein DFH09DRAFT_1159194 [Mycena vulgaris]|nr:hypothetical protein DFH09DRAFT_1159194 [Mycena vulgaris]